MEKEKTEGMGDWKINGVCDWQPMILGIRLIGLGGENQLARTSGFIGIR